MLEVRFRRLGPAALAAACLLAAGPGRAAADRALARALVEDGERLRAAGAREAALERFEEAIAADPDYLPAYDSATELWLRGERFALVIDRLARLTLRHPRHAPAWYALAFAYRRSGRPDLAVLCYEAYLALRPGEPDPYYGLAMARLELGQRAEAAAALERYLALEKRPERAEFAARARLELDRLRGGTAAGDPAALWRRAGERLRELVRAGRALLAP